MVKADETALVCMCVLISLYLLWFYWRRASAVAAVLWVIRTNVSGDTMPLEAVYRRSEHLGISRRRVRTALNYLEIHGLVSVRGMTVNEHKDKDS